MCLLKRWKKICSPPYLQLHIEESLYLLLSGSIWCILIKKNVCEIYAGKQIGVKSNRSIALHWNWMSQCFILHNKNLKISCIKKIDWAQEPLTACSSLWGFNMLKDTIYYKVHMPHKYLCGKGHANHFKASVLPTFLSHNKGVEKQTLQWSQYCTSTVKIVILLYMFK